MPNFLIGVLAQRTVVIFNPIVDACPIDTSFMNEIYFTPIVDACPVDTSTMDIIYNI